MKSWLYLFLSCNNLLHIKWNISHFSSLAFPPSDKFHVTDPSVTHRTWDTQKEGHVRHRVQSLGRTGRPTRSLYSTYHCHGREQPSISVTVWHVTQCSSYRSVPAVPLWGGQILLYLSCTYTQVCYLARGILTHWKALYLYFFVVLKVIRMFCKYLGWAHAI